MTLAFFLVNLQSRVIAQVALPLWKSGKAVVHQLLCFSWIDGIRKSVDDLSHTIRVTPRKPRSNCSAINVKRVKELTKMGLRHPAGLKAFQVRDLKKSGVWSK